MEPIKTMGRETPRPELNETPSTPKCLGHCCRMFWLPFTPEKLHMVVWARSIYGYNDANGWPEGIPNYVNAERVADIVIYRGTFTREQLVEYGRRRGLAVPLPGLKGEDNHGSWYTCKLLDWATNLCTDYENRPDMCMNFPWFGSCTYPGCDHPKPPAVVNGKTVVDLKLPAKHLNIDFRITLDEENCTEDVDPEATDDNDVIPGTISSW